jgi:hypothetical protein
LLPPYVTIDLALSLHLVEEVEPSALGSADVAGKPSLKTTATPAVPRRRFTSMPSLRQL